MNNDIRRNGLAGGNGITVRPAAEDDAEAMRAIYNFEVINGTATLDLHPKTAESWTRWFRSHNNNKNEDNHPLFAAELGGRVVGYASLSPYREKEAFSSTVELSVYVDASYRGRGVATALLERVIAEARSDARTHLIVSVITAGNDASRHLHEKFGFEFCGTIREAGLKFGEFRDIENYALIV